MVTIHKSITRERVGKAVLARMTTLDDPGFCIACGKRENGVEADAAELKCEGCGKPKVYGAEFLLIALV